MAANINSNVEKRVVELVKNCYFGSCLNKSAFMLLMDRVLYFFV